MSIHALTDCIDCAASIPHGKLRTWAPKDGFRTVKKGGFRATDGDKLSTFTRFLKNAHASLPRFSRSGRSLDFI